MEGPDRRSIAAGRAANSGDARMTHIGTLSVEDAAAELVGNWKKYECFAWYRRTELDDPDSWAVCYTSRRDSGLLDKSNSAFITKKLEPFTEGDAPDVVAEIHSHFAVGYLDGYSIRVYRDGRITEAFRTYHSLTERLEQYPVLDEADYSCREYQVTIENIGQAARRLCHEYTLPDDWEGDVYSWFSEYNQRAVENRGDQGGYPSENDLRAAFSALGYQPIEVAE
jgi:hypothetical protein